MNKEKVKRFVNLSVNSISESKTFGQTINGQVNRIVKADYTTSGDNDISFVNDGGLFHGNLRVPDKYFILPDGTTRDAKQALSEWMKNAKPKLTVGSENYIGVYGFEVPIIELSDGKVRAIRNKQTGREMQYLRIATPNDDKDTAIAIAYANYSRATNGEKATHDTIAAVAE